MRSSRVQQYKLCVIRMTQQVPDGFLPYFVTWYDDVMKKKKDWTSLILHHGNVVFRHVCVCCLAAGQRRNRARDVHGYTCEKTSWGNESEPRKNSRQYDLENKLRKHLRETIEEDKKKIYIKFRSLCPQKLRTEIIHSNEERTRLNWSTQYHLVVHFGTTDGIWSKFWHWKCQLNQKQLLWAFHWYIIHIIIYNLIIILEMWVQDDGSWMCSRNVNTVCPDSRLQSEAGATSPHPQPKKSESQCSSMVCSPFQKPLFEVTKWIWLTCAADICIELFLTMHAVS